MAWRYTVIQKSFGTNRRFYPDGRARLPRFASVSSLFVHFLKKLFLTFLKKNLHNQIGWGRVLIIGDKAYNTTTNNGEQHYE